jgi:hypothetical protein
MSLLIRRWSLVFLVLLWPIIVHAQMPAFADYQVSEHYKGKTAPLILSGVDPTARAKLKVAARQKPNFAGHYIVVTWSCGNECLTGSVIDAITGKVYALPVTVCCWNQEGREPLKPIDFRVDSKLLVLKGGRNGKACDLGEHYYQFEKDRFDLIKTTSAQQCP